MVDKECGVYSHVGKYANIAGKYGHFLFLRPDWKRPESDGLGSCSQFFLQNLLASLEATLPLLIIRRAWNCDLKGEILSSYYGKCNTSAVFVKTRCTFAWSSADNMVLSDLSADGKVKIFGEYVFAAGN